MGSIFEQLKRCLEEEQLVALATVVSGGNMGRKLLVWPDRRSEGHLGSGELNDKVIPAAIAALNSQQTGSVEVELPSAPEERVEVFIEVYPPPPKLIIVGAVHVAIPLVSLAKTMGFRTIVIDARSVFATPERFAHADELIVKWPADALKELGINEATYIVFLSHDEKLDNPGLEVALRGPARYVGALGSKKTHAKRVASLKEMGVSDEELARIHAPIGLPLGGKRPEDIAVSIIAQIVAVKNAAA